MAEKHTSVLKDETIDGLNIRKGKVYVDCTLGAGGHASSILEKLDNTGFLYAFDQDADARRIAEKKLLTIGNNFEIIPTNFVALRQSLYDRNCSSVDGILFDIGVSSMQLDEQERGFSYRFDAPLDMRMDKDGRLSAYEVVNKYDYSTLVNIFYKYGEEKYAKSIARKIIEQREIAPIKTTFELVEVIRQGVPAKAQKLKHPAKKVFQAIRIEVNNELQVFEDALEQAISILNPGGRLCVITFHSLEDKIAKRLFQKYGKQQGPASKVELLCDQKDDTTLKIITRKPIIANDVELQNNRRAKSAKLRIAEKK